MKTQEEIREKEEKQDKTRQALPRKETAGEPMSQEPMPQEFEDHIRDLEAQGERLKEAFPEFDLLQELQDPVFLQLTAPGTGISVEAAYYALHHQQILKQQARELEQKIVSSIQARGRRPLEAGTTGQAPSLTTFRYDAASKDQREAFKKELRRAWGRGETVYPGR